jgi:hypothetical protein
MPSRPDIRDLAANVKEAFGDADRETLLDVLTFVVKEYVVEGPPPMLIHQAETLSDLQNASFAQLITAMQTRFDHPELAMFVVDGDQVSVRVGGVVHPLLPGRQPLAAVEPPRPQPGVRVVEANLAPRIPPTPSPASAQIPGTGAAPPPRGLSVRGQPAPTPGPNAPPAAPRPQPAPAAPPAGAAAPAPAAPATAPDKPESGGDDAAARFSLLELD